MQWWKIQTLSGRPLYTRALTAQKAQLEAEHLGYIVLKVEKTEEPA